MRDTDTAVIPVFNVEYHFVMGNEVPISSSEG